MRRLAPLVLALAFVSTASATPLPTPCTLLSTAEVANVLETSIAYHTTNARSCTWTSLSLGTYGPSATLTAGVQRGTLTNFKVMETQTPGIIRLPGIGEAAFSATTPQGSTMRVLWILKRGSILDISVSTVSSPLNVEKAAAKFALKRL